MAVHDMHLDVRVAAEAFDQQVGDRADAAGDAGWVGRVEAHQGDA